MNQSKIIINSDVLLSLEEQLQILKKTKRVLINNRVPIILRRGFCFIHGEHVVGVCGAIKIAAVLLNSINHYEYGTCSSKQLITFHNIENAINFCNARDNRCLRDCYWWDTCPSFGKKFIRNIKPRLLYIDWLINQTEYAIIKRNNGL